MELSRGGEERWPDGRREGSGNLMGIRLAGNSILLTENWAIWRRTPDLAPCAADEQTGSA